MLQIVRTSSQEAGVLFDAKSLPTKVDLPLLFALATTQIQHSGLFGQHHSVSVRSRIRPPRDIRSFTLASQDFSVQLLRDAMATQYQSLVAALCS